MKASATLWALRDANVHVRPHLLRRGKKASSLAIFSSMQARKRRATRTPEDWCLDVADEWEVLVPWPIIALSTNVVSVSFFQWKACLHRWQLGLHLTNRPCLRSTSLSIAPVSKLPGAQRGVLSPCFCGRLLPIRTYRWTWSRTLLIQCLRPHPPRL